MPDSLRGREVVVVGGSGGIGSALTELLLAEGARLTISYRANRGRARRWQDAVAFGGGDRASCAGCVRLLGGARLLYGLVVLAGRAEGFSGVSKARAAAGVWEEGNRLGPTLLAREA